MEEIGMRSTQMKPGDIGNLKMPHKNNGMLSRLCVLVAIWGHGRCCREWEIKKYYEQDGKFPIRNGILRRNLSRPHRKKRFVFLSVDNGFFGNYIIVPKDARNVTWQKLIV